MKQTIHDRVGLWTEVKEEIIRSYAIEYAKILSKHPEIKGYAYIDGFAGSGTHEVRKSGMVIQGSPQIALSIEPPFTHYYFIDLKQERTDVLKGLGAGRNNVTIINDDCNIVVPGIFEEWKFTKFRRALCILDPYNLNPNWDVIKAAQAACGPTGGIDLFINFSIMDANRNVFRKNIQKTNERDVQRMNEFWGDNSWTKIAFVDHQTLFEDFDTREKQSNKTIVNAYLKRLKEVAGYRFVSKPFPMLTNSNAVIYYLIFATMNETASKIVSHILEKFRKAGIRYSL